MPVVVLELTPEYLFGACNTSQHYLKQDKKAQGHLDNAPEGLIIDVSQMSLVDKLHRRTAPNPSTTSTARRFQQERLLQS
eukprot:6115229-Amphidinium_carterae.1